MKQRQSKSKAPGRSCSSATGTRGGRGTGDVPLAASGGTRGCGGRAGRGSRGRGLGDPDVHLLAGFAVAGLAAYEEVVAVALQLDGVVAGGVGGDGRRRLARLVVLPPHLQHIVVGVVVLEHCHAKADARVKIRICINNIHG